MPKYCKCVQCARRPGPCIMDLATITRGQIWEIADRLKSAEESLESLREIVCAIEYTEQ